MSCPHGSHPDACDICDEVAAAYNSGVEHTKREWVSLTDEEILADDTLRYHFGMNGGAGPLSEKGKAIVGAFNALLKERNT